MIRKPWPSSSEIPHSVQPFDPSSAPETRLRARVPERGLVLTILVVLPVPVPIPLVARAVGAALEAEDGRVLHELRDP